MKQLVQVHSVAMNNPSLRKPWNVINWHDSSDRKWLAGHVNHCMTHGIQVTLSPLAGESFRG